jgi:hypothetical protein
MASPAPLLQRLKILQRAAPGEFRAAYQELAQYHVNVMADMLEAGPDQLPVSQGVARGVRALLLLFKDCDGTSA